MGEVRHLGEFGGLVPPPYRIVVVSLAWLVFVVWLGLCLLFGAIALPYWGAATHCKNKKKLT